MKTGPKDWLPDPRYVVIVSQGGLIQGARFFGNFKAAKIEADRVAKDLDYETDDVVVLDISIHWRNEQRVYQPISRRE